MKKKMLSVVLAVFVVIACVFMSSACGDNPPEPMTNAELVVVYKDAAVETWEGIGVSDPTLPAAQASKMSVTVPNKTTETTDVDRLANIKVNANAMAGFLYMVSLLYGNENFAVTDNVAVFDATITMSGQNIPQNYVLQTSVNQTENKIYLEIIVTVYGTPQYSLVEVGYDFKNGEVTSYRLSGTVLNEYYDMALTEDNKNMWYSTTDISDDFVVALKAKQDELTTKASGIEKLEVAFDTEVQTYFDVLQAAMAEMLK